MEEGWIVKGDEGEEGDKGRGSREWKVGKAVVEMQN